MKDQAKSLQFDLTDFLPFQMSVVATRAFERIIDEAGLQLPEWRIVMALSAHQPCSSQDLCALTDMDAARVSRAQRRLEDLNLISVIRDKGDRRRLVVRLSDRGDLEVTRLKFAAREIETSMLRDLGPEDRVNLRTTINGLYETM